MSKFTGSKKATQFTESVIREMTRLNQMYGGVNLSQGFPDFPAPAVVKDAACAAIQADVNQYAVTWGTRSLREAIAREFGRRYGVTVVPDEQVTVCCGATEAMMATMMAIIDPGDEVVVFEPFYENYGPDAILAGANPVFVPLDQPDWKLNPDSLRKAFNSRTKAIIVNTPHNPTGRVFTREEMSLIAELCIEHDAWAITDGPYEHMVYSGHHHEIATWPGMRERTITVSSLSKTWSATGWRIGWIIAPPAQTSPIRKVHDFLTVGAPAPLQTAAAVGFAFGADYYNQFTANYKQKRDYMCEVLREAGFKFATPQGAYYIFADFSELSDLDDVTFAKWMTQEIGVATVPGSSFFSRKEEGRAFTRFAFCKKQETLEHAAERLSRLRALV